MTFFTDGDAVDQLAADQPVHAGITRKLYQDNLLCTYENVSYDHHGYILSGDEIGVKPAASGEWEILNAHPILLPIYPAEGGGYRTLTFSMEMRVTGGTGSIAIYLLPAYTIPAVDVTDGLPEITTTATVTSDSATYSVKAVAAITPDSTCIRYVDCGSVADGVVLPCTYVRFLMKNSAGSSTYFRGIRVVEGD